MKRGSLSIGMGGAGAAALALASQAEAEAGTDHSRAMTPLRVAQAIAALGGGGGGGAVGVEGVCFVNGYAGNDLTGDGSISHPYATLQAASETLGSGTRAFFIVGEVGGLTNPTTLNFGLLGIGRDFSVVGPVVKNDAGPGSMLLWGNGAQMIYVSRVEVCSAAGAHGSVGAPPSASPSSGSDGLDSANLNLCGIHVGEDVRVIGGAGGAGGGGGDGARAFTLAARAPRLATAATVGSSG